MVAVFYPTRLTACLGNCGEQVEYKTNKRVYCKVCRLKKIRETSRTAMEKVRRSNGAEQLKGMLYACSVCSVLYERKVPRSHRCNSCQKAAEIEVSRKKAADKRSTVEGKEYARRWAKNQRKCNPGFSVSSHMGTLIHRALGKGKAGKSWRTFVDYSLEELMLHLERQFLPGMTWQNKGEWHIDHIVPRASFEYSSAEDEEFKRAWALSNLRPIWARDNVQKNATRTHLI